MVTTPTEGRTGHVAGSADEQRAMNPVTPPRRTRVEWNGLSGVREVRVRILNRRGREPGSAHDPGDRSERLLGEVCEPLS